MQIKLTKIASSFTAKLFLLNKSTVKNCEKICQLNVLTFATVS